MEEKRKPAASVNMQPTITNYGTVASMALIALRSAIIELAPDRSDLKWLDELEQNLMLEAKASSIDGIDISREAEALTAGVQSLQATLMMVRRDLSPDKLTS